MTPENYTAALYADVKELLTHGIPEAPKPDIGRRDDGSGIIYSGASNIIFGPPETAKTLVCSAISADVLFSGGSALIIDIDHNGAPATIARFRSFGVPADVLTDTSRFRYASPEDATQMLAIIKEAQEWKPTIAIVDSIGELMPMFNANSNLPDDYTRVHRTVMSALAKPGTAVLGVDHEAKGEASSNYGASGTAAKKRVLDGVMLRARLVRPFAPGMGGKTKLHIAKDRHGGLRAASPAGDREPVATTFELMAGAASNWKFHTPVAGEIEMHVTLAEDVKQLVDLTPPPSSIRDVKQRCGWGQDRAKAALDAFRNSPDVTGAYLRTPPPYRGGSTRVHPTDIPGYSESALEVHEYTNEVSNV